MKLLSLLWPIVIVACSPSSTDQYETTSKARVSSTTIEMHWINSASIGEVCARLGTSDGPLGSKYRACARSKPDNLAICEVYVVQPENFDDTTALESLGHEVWHCLGARHN